MKNRLYSAFSFLNSAFSPVTLASIGEARLVKHLSGKIELLGGSPDDRRAAKEWCSLFLHEAVITSPATRLDKSAIGVTVTPKHKTIGFCNARRLACDS